MKYFKYKTVSKSIILSAVLLLFTISMSAQDITGTWAGKLDAMGTELKINFNIEKTELGYSATMDSPDQGAYGIPCSEFSFTNNKVSFSIKALMVKYAGTLKDDKIEGTFTQSGINIPLNLTKTEGKVSAPNRPQEPQEPYPYYTEDLTFENKKEGIKLAGTLTLPSQKGKYPVVVLISGSGAQDRNQEIMGHKPFLVIADYLARNGIGVLRFDDRGTAESGGDFETATTNNFANDVEAAVEYLLSRKDVDKKKIGLIGHSEGGIIAPMVATRNKKVSFIVLLAGTGVRGDELLMMQTRAISEVMGMPSEVMNQAAKINRALYDIILESSKDDNWEESLKAFFDTHTNNSALEGMPDEPLEQLRTNMHKQFANPWLRNFIAYNPANDLKKVKIPVLALNGSLDLQVPPKENLAAIEAALKQAKNKKYKVVELEGLNHLFQEAETGLPTEYGQIGQTFSPRALEVMLEWIKGVV